MKRAFTLGLIFFTAVLSARTVKILEVPSELGAGTRGASLAPRAVETAALNDGDEFFHKHSVLRVDPDNQALYYASNSPHAKYIEALSKVIERTASPVARVMEEKNTFLIVIAGDHSTAAGTLAGMKKAYAKQRIGAIWIDAHADIHTPYTTPSGNMHGMPVAIAMKEDNQLKKVNKLDADTIAKWEKLKSVGGEERSVQPSDLVYIAVRDTEPQEDFLIRKYNIKNYAVEDIRRRSTETIANEALKRLRHCDVIYVSFDVDSMDSSLTQGTGTPVANGLNLKEAEALLVHLAQSPKVRCMEFAEINPLLDQQNKMAEISFHLIKQVANAAEKKTQ
jgi:arginase